MNIKKLIIISFVLILFAVIITIANGLFAKNEDNHHIIEQHNDIAKQEKNVDCGDFDGEQDAKENDDKLPVYDVSYINDCLLALGGNCQWGVQLYNSDYLYVSESSPVSSASVIKVYIMEYAFTLVENGELSLDDNIGSISLSQLINSMITVSDNYSTNVLIDYFTMEKLNEFFAENGYTDTKIERRMLDYDAMAQGKDNYTSINDVMRFLDKLYKNKDIFPYADMIDIMINQQRRNKIPAYLPETTIIANKTGELSDVENDIGIVFSEKGDFAVAFLLTSLTDTYSARIAISDCTKYLYNLIE